MMLALKSGPQIAAKVGNPAGLLCRRIWYSVGKSGVLGITEYRQGRPLYIYIYIYSAVSSPLDRSKRFTCFAFPGRPAHSDTNSASPGSILAMQQLRATTKSLTVPPLSIARYSFIQLSQLGRQWRERKCPIFETVAITCDTDR